MAASTTPCSKPAGWTSPLTRHGMSQLRELMKGSLAPWPARPNTSACAISLRQIFRRRCTVRSRPSGYRPGYVTCNRSSSWPPVDAGLASNHARSSSVTATSGSGRRRPRFAFGFGFDVGRTSPSCHAVRSPETNVLIGCRLGHGGFPPQYRGQSPGHTCLTRGAARARTAVPPRGPPPAILKLEKLSSLAACGRDRKWRGEVNTCSIAQFPPL